MASMALMPVCIGSLTGWRWHDVGRLDLELAALGRLDVALAVERAAERVDHAAEEAVADRDREHVAGAADLPGPPRCAAESPRMTQPISRTSRFSAMPSRPPSNSSSSLVMAP